MIPAGIHLHLNILPVAGIGGSAGDNLAVFCNCLLGYVCTIYRKLRFVKRFAGKTGEKEKNFAGQRKYKVVFLEFLCYNAKKAGFPPRRKP